MYIASNITNIILTIYAFSDIYSILSYGRIKTYIEKTHNKLIPYLTTLSGDFISPVKYTNIDDGLTVMQVLDVIPIDIVSLGNHEFDIEPIKLNNSLNINKGTKFISTNINYIANTKDYDIYYDYKTNLTIGFVGLCTENFYYKYPIRFKNYSEINNTIQHIIKKYNTSMIIGLTHAELEEDIEYSIKFPQLNLILGGHVHSYGYHENSTIPIVRTGENADSIYEINILQDKTFLINLIDISDLKPHSSIEKIYMEKEKIFEQYNKENLFYFNSVYTNYNPRTNVETLPQLMCTLITKYFSTELTILNSGMFKLRGKDFYGNFTVGHFTELIPYNDYITVIQINSNDLIEGIKYSNTVYYNDGGYLQLDNWKLVNEYNSSLKNVRNISLSISTLILDGINSNPHFEKYKLKNKYDGTPIQNIIMSYKDNIY